MDFSVLLLLVACAVSIALSTGSIVWCSLFSNPARFKREVDNVHASALHAIGQVEEIQAKFLQHRTEMGGIAESVEGMLESVDRKRRSITAAASRLQVPGREPEPVTRDEIVSAARKQIYGVG